MTITFTNNNETESQKLLHYATMNFCSLAASYGYEAQFPYFEKGILRLELYAKKNRYLPKISFNRTAYRKTGEIKWELNMSAYGSLSGEELQQWFDAQKIAVDFVHRLERETPNLQSLLPDVVFSAE